MILLFLKGYWKVLAVATAVGLLLYWFTGKLEDADRAGYSRARAEMAADVAKANAATAEREAAARRASAIKDAEWRGERDELQKQVVDLLARRVSIRVCKPAAGGGTVPGVPESAAQFDGAAGAGEPALRVGPDVGSRVVQLAGECERYRRQLAELQAWIKSASD